MRVAGGISAPFEPDGVERLGERSQGRTITIARLRGPVAAGSLLAAAVAAVASAIATAVAGRIAAEPTAGLVQLLALCLIGGAVLDTAARAAWSGAVDRAEGRLRGDVLAAALHQPLSALSEHIRGDGGGGLARPRPLFAFRRAGLRSAGAARTRPRRAPPAGPVRWR